MANGQRQGIPDIATQLVFVHAKSEIVAIEAADLTAIPEGPVLPTRADNTLYQGTGATYGYLMQSGKSARSPDATTLRDSGFDFHALVPISTGDLAFISGWRGVSQHQAVPGLGVVTCSPGAIAGAAGNAVFKATIRNCGYACIPTTCMWITLTLR